MTIIQSTADATTIVRRKFDGWSRDDLEFQAAFVGAVIENLEDQIADLKNEIADVESEREEVGDRLDDLDDDLNDDLDDERAAFRDGSGR
jgi:uncharacterized coiled-coil protein SlyX